MVNVPPGAHVVLRDMEGSRKVFRITTGGKDLRMGKYPPVPADAVLGVPYGATLRRGESGWVRHHRVGLEASVEELGDAGETNQHLAQDNSAQALTPGQVSEMKRKCNSEDVVTALASNSATFSSKTRFAQEKYLKKKQQKHVQQINILRPTMMELCEAYLSQSRQKMCGLRFDYLSAILCQADARIGARILALDCACGLVTGALAQQLAGSGRVFRVHGSSCPDKGITELDLGVAQNVVRSIPLEVLQAKDPYFHPWLQTPDNLSQEATPEERCRWEARCQRSDTRQGDVRDLLDGPPLNAIVIVAGDEDVDLASDALSVGLSHLGPNGRVVIFGSNLQPLAAKQGEMRSGGSFLEVRLIQLFTRELQVLPQRTHPFMTQDARHMEGFLLTATKVVDEPGCESSGAANGNTTGAPKRHRNS